MGIRKSATGNNPFGFTFVEVMVALVILCSGIVMVYKSFFLCADYLNNLTYRMYASSLLDEKIGDITKVFAEWPAKPMDFGGKTTALLINHKSIPFTFDINLAPLNDVKSVWQVDVNLTWPDGPRTMHAFRSAYLNR